MTIRQCPPPGKPEELKAHPLAELNPDMGGEQFAELLEDISANGLRVPIVLFCGLILDGRHRLRACLLLGITPEFAEFVGSEDEAAAYALSMECRRHQTPDERREHAQRLHDAGMSLRQIAKRLGVHHETVRRGLSAGKSVANATPERTGERHDRDADTGDEPTPTAKPWTDPTPVDRTPAVLRELSDAAERLAVKALAAVRTVGIGEALERELHDRGIVTTSKRNVEPGYRGAAAEERRTITGVPLLDGLLGAIDAAVSSAAKRHGEVNPW